MKRKRSTIQFATPNSINKHLFCSICQDVFQDPRHIACGHTFCYYCIKKWFSKGRAECPVCRARVSRYEMKKDLIPKKIIDEYEVFCPHNEKGCEWTKSLGELDDHLKKCPFEKKKKLEKSEGVKNKNCILVDDEGEESQKEVINVEENNACSDGESVPGYSSFEGEIPTTSLLCVMPPLRTFLLDAVFDLSNV